jgi:hypothetical protein
VSAFAGAGARTRTCAVPHQTPVPVPVLAPHTSNTRARTRDGVRWAGRTARVRVIVLPPRNVTLPSTMKTAPPSFCARHRSGAGPPRARSRRGRPACAAEGRRAVALVSEIATPSNTSSPLNMATTPPFICTRADAERSGALFSCMRSRDASRGGTAHATCASLRRMRMPCVQTSTCACCDCCSTCYQSARIASRPSRLFYKLSRPHIPAQNAACSVLDQTPVPVPVLAPQTRTPSACERVCVRQSKVCACRERIRRRRRAYAHVYGTTSNTSASASASTAH